MEETAVSLGARIRKREISCVESAKFVLDNIARTDSKVNAYSFVLDTDEILNRAKRVQALIDRGESLSILAGVPMGIKDNICTKDVITSCASKMLYNFRPPYDATVVERLNAAGAVMLGKLNMDEFAMGGSTENSCYGATHNPWDVSRVPGGSSGGSAAAVVSNEAFYTLGSDTGGSIRQPCSFCGISGIKPTYGVVSRYGLVAFASSLDQIGPMAMTIQDCAEILSIIGGYDPKDSTSVKKSNLDFSKSFTANIKGLKIGIPNDYFGEGLDEDVRRVILEAAQEFKALGAELVEFRMPVVEYAIPTYYVIACAEASSNLARYDGVKYGFRSKNAEDIMSLICKSRSEGFGMEVKRRIMLGSFVLSAGYSGAYYKKGLAVRALIKKSFEEAFERCDVILAPNAPTVAYKVGENISDPIKMYMGDIYDASVNLAGLPAVTIPCGFGDCGMPVGLQLIGSAFDEATLVRVAHAFQQHTDYHKQRPDLEKLSRGE